MIKIMYGSATRTYGVTEQQVRDLGIDIAPSAIDNTAFRLSGVTIAQFEELIRNIDGALTTTSNNTQGINVTLSMNGNRVTKTITQDNFMEYKGENSWYNGDVTISTFSQLTEGMIIKVAGKQSGNGCDRNDG